MLIDTVADQENVNGKDTARQDDENAGCGMISIRMQKADMPTRKAMSSCAGETMKQGD